MARGRKKITEEESNQTENNETLKPATRMVNAEHTIKYREPLPVPLTESESSEEETSWVYEDDEDAENRQRKPKQTIQEKLRAKLKKSGVATSDQTYLRIDRLLNYEATGSDGMNGDREFCWRGPCTVEYITNDDYLNDTLKRHGAGNYWFTFRDGKKVVATWQHRIGGAPQVATQQSDPMTGQSQIIYQPLPLSQPPATTSPTLSTTKTLRELAEVIEVVDRIRGDREPGHAPQSTQEQQLSPEAQVLNLAAKSPGFIESVIDKFVDKGEREPSFTELIFKHGPELANALGSMLQTVIRTAAEEFKQVRQANGDYQQYVRNEVAAETLQNNEVAGRSETPESQARQKGMESMAQIETQSDRSPMDEQRRQNGQSPEDALLTLVCDNCTRQIPPKITAQRINEFADVIAEQAPHLSVDGWIDMFCQYDTDTIINLASQGVFGEQGRQIAVMTHAQEWIGDLRDILKESEKEEESNDGEN